MLLYGLYTSFFLFPILLSSNLDFCEKFLKKFFLNSKQIMKSDMGILGGG